MADFKLYIHGVPVGHEMCGCHTEDERRYLRGFYDFNPSKSPVLVAEQVVGTAYYSYICKGNFFNVEGRPGSYFGLTISFGKMYCTDVCMLYKIMEDVFQKFCRGTLVVENESGSQFKVREIESTTIKGKPILEHLRYLLGQYIEKYLTPYSFSKIQEETSSKGDAFFHPNDLDSPYFKEVMRSKRVLVSQGFTPLYAEKSVLAEKLRSKEDALDKIKRDYATLKASYEESQKDNESLKTNNKKLLKEREETIGKLSRDHASEKKRCREQLDATQAELENCKAENERLREQLEEVAHGVESIQDPLKSLSRLVAGRFQKEDEDGPPFDGEDVDEVGEVHRQKVINIQVIRSWVPVINLVLLLCLMALSIFFYSHERTASDSGKVELPAIILPSAVYQDDHVLDSTEDAVVEERDTLRQEPDGATPEP